MIHDTFKKGSLLFLGVGGMGMAPLAAWMARAGYAIVGYDDNLTDPVRRFLSESGVAVEDFVFGEQLERFTGVVFSSALQANHPLLQAARDQGLELLRRGEMLARVARGKRLIAIVGSHGKTTTSGMIAHGVRLCGLDVNYILGGFFNNASMPPCAYSEGDWLVAEVDESDGTIDRFCPEVTVVLNIDWDHADHYTSSTMLDEAFRQLVARTTGRVLFPCGSRMQDCFTETNGADVMAFGPRGHYKIVSQEDRSLQVSGHFSKNTLEPPPIGRFNYTNGMAALSVLSILGADFPANILSSFMGMARRQTLLHESPSLRVMEDYAHHPTELVSLIDCLRQAYPDERLVVVFQAHRYTRTKQFKDAFADALNKVDDLFLLPVYSAHEAVLEGGDLSDLLEAFKGTSPDVLRMDLSGVQDLKTFLDTTKEAVTLVFVGAGDIDLFADAFVSFMGEESDLGRTWSAFLEGRVSDGCVLKQNEPLANKTTMRVGGAANYYAEPATLSDLRLLLRAAELFQLEIFTIGRGSNLIVPDEGFSGLVIRLSGGVWRHTIDLGGGRIWAGAGVRLKEVCGIAAKLGLSGFEFMEGIPGAVGGSLRMNAGAMGSWIFDVVERVQFIDESGTFRDFPKEAFNFGYRKVEEISRGIALGAILKSSGPSEESIIRERMDTYSSSRKEAQPREPSAGCIFKNPEGNYSGKLIDTYGIKGMRVGAAEVSNIHGNFIVNRGGATASDVVELVRRVRASIYEKSGYLLEPEVLLVGQAWDTLLCEDTVFKEVVNND